MRRLFKNSVQSVLKRFGYRIVYSPQKTISGLSLTDDMKVIVGTETPLCFDVGANEGQTIEFIQSAFRAPEIYAFEPSTRTFAELRSRKFGPQVQIHQIALGEQNAH